MDKNCIEGRCDGMSWHNTAKSSGSVVAVNAVVVPGSNVLLPGEVLRSHGRLRKSAEAIVANNEPETRWGLQRKRPEDSMS